MKVPPKRKGNFTIKNNRAQKKALNESPSEKEGKSNQNPTNYSSYATPQ